MPARILCTLLAFLFFHSAVAAGKGLGIGVIVGEPTGLSIKSWMSKRSAVDAALAWSLEGRGFLHFHTDYLLHNDRILNIRELRGRLALYYGMGLRFRLRENDDVDMGIRFPLGLTYLIPRSPFDIFVEIVPIFDLIPSTGFYMNGGLGARFYF